MVCDPERMASVSTDPTAPQIPRVRPSPALAGSWLRAKRGDGIGALRRHRGRDTRPGSIPEASLWGLARSALTEGRVGLAAVDAMMAEVDTWAECRDAFYAETWCAAIGWVH
jgi:hypothetical protein